MRLYLFFLLVSLVLIDAENHIHNQKINNLKTNDKLYELSNENQNNKVDHHSQHHSKYSQYRHKRHHKVKYSKSKDSSLFLRKELINNSESNKGATCGFDACTARKEGAINVHIINHSHCDVGWLKTVGQYFFGLKNNVQRAGVQYIISSVIEELRKDPKRKFIFVETAFFRMWWNDQNNEMKTFVRQLVNEGRFEFISGGWSMNDEAAAHYLSIIDQMTFGHQWLIENFGHCAIPKIGWQIDPFGHAREQASLFAQMGFEGLFFGRLDYNDKSKRASEKNLEMIWRGSDDLKESSDLFTGVLPNGYNPPNSFCFDDTCGDESIVEDKASTEYNVERRVDEYIKAINDQAQMYKTNDLIHTMGSDFQYQNALPWYLNLDRLIKHVHERNSSINVFYSTPTCYLKALHDANQTWPTKTDDFFPYSSDPHAFWSGYFTSRPAFKGFERWASSHLQSAKHLQVLANLVSEEHNQLRDKLKEALGISQHHDAITGTEKQNVLSDYVLILDRGVEAANQLISQSLDKIYNSSNYSPQLTANKVEFCRKLNVSECSVSEQNNKFVVHLYNPLSHSIQHLVRLPVKDLKNENDIVLMNSSGQKISFEVVDIADHVKNLPERTSNADKEIVFFANLSATSLSTFTIDLTNASSEPIRSNELLRDIDELNRAQDWNGILEGLGFKLHIDKSTGATKKVVLDNGKEIKFEQEYKYYMGALGDNTKFEKRSSGAYIFRPNGTVQTFDNQNNKVTFQTKATFGEVHVTTSDYVKHTIRVNKKLPYIEFDYVVGPIPVDDNVGKEIITTIKTDLKTNGEFYTDSNGRQYLKRVRNQRPTYSYNISDEPVASNYYPLNSKMELRDEEQGLRLAVLIDRSEGGSSMNDGELEIMLHRRLLHDDAFGVGEALNEPGLHPGEKGDGLQIRGVHRVMINSLNKDQETEYTVNELALRQSQQPLIAFRKLNENVDVKEIYAKAQEESILSGPLPKCVNLLTLEAYAHFKILRFEHLYGKLDNAQCSDQTIELDIEKIFNPKYKVHVFGETYLTTVQHKSAPRLEWRSDFQVQDRTEAMQMRNSWAIQNKGKLPSYLDNLTGDATGIIYNPKFTLKPTEIRTLLVFFDDAEKFE